MPCEFPRVSVSSWTGSLKFAGPSYRKVLQELTEAINKGEVVAIVGQPGTGKTTLLRVLASLVQNHVFMDMANKERLADEFWDKFDPKARSKEILEMLLPERRKFGYGLLSRLLGRRFEDHLLRVCDKYDDPRLRLYCNKYTRDFDGMLRALKDYSAVFGKPVLLVDEVRETHSQEILRFVNSGVGVPLVFSMPTEAYSKVTDLAIRRRIEESRVSLDYILTEEDIREILDSYCPDFSAELTDLVIPLWKGKEIVTVHQLLNYARMELENAKKECGDNECVRRRLIENNIFKDVDNLIKTVESTLRSGLAKVEGVTYVHQRGKRAETSDGKSVIVDLFFLTEEGAYVGDVRIFAGLPSLDPDVEALAKILEIEHEKVKRPVKGRFLITNYPLKVEGVITVYLETHELIRVSKGDSEVVLAKLLNALGLGSEAKGQTKAQGAELSA
jgi:energy-coupling factor transporter ATP-binding protein EcfA2